MAKTMYARHSGSRGTLLPTAGERRGLLRYRLDDAEEFALPVSIGKQAEYARPNSHQVKPPEHDIGQRIEARGQIELLEDRDVTGTPDEQLTPFQRCESEAA